MNNNKSKIRATNRLKKMMKNVVRQHHRKSWSIIIWNILWN